LQRNDERKAVPVDRGSLIDKVGGGLLDQGDQGIQVPGRDFVAKRREPTFRGKKRLVLGGSEVYGKLY